MLASFIFVAFKSYDCKELTFRIVLLANLLLVSVREHIS